jgi:threonine aldolase
MATEVQVIDRNSTERLVGTIDLRSDTVTRPTAAMRAAMAAAEVGDDVYGEDPTINRLEARAAEVFGREAAIFVPTGTMGNQIAIRLHTQHGQEVICESRSHIVDWELAMVAAFSGCQLRTIQADRGILTWSEIKAAILPKIYYRAATGLISLENTHNRAAGRLRLWRCWRRFGRGPKEAGLPVHLDGARVFHAATYLGLSVAELTRGFDTVMFCLSKGLCAPVGSMLVGSRELIDRARIYRKALGGGMRQAGVLAAAGLIALDEMTLRLAEDHANARLLAEGLAELPEVEIDLGAVQTNLVIFQLKNGRYDSLLARLKARGVLASTVNPPGIRLVTHHDVSREACEQALAILIEEIRRS